MLGLDPAVVEQLASFFRRNGYIRRLDAVRRRTQGHLYKKGAEIRLVAESELELRLIQRLLVQAGFRVAHPFVKGGQWRQPLYGVSDVSRFLELIGESPKGKLAANRTPLRSREPRTRMAARKKTVAMIDRMTPDRAATALANAGKEFVMLFKHGSVEVEFYKPNGVDRQKPHKRDELYIVAAGSGVFVIDGACHSFATGEVLFAPAESEHRFEFFTPDFATWVIFYGPEGGEAH